MKGPLGVVVVIVVLSIMLGILIFKACTALPGQTREAFSQQCSCPLDTITSNERPDVCCGAAGFRAASLPARC